MNWHHLRAGLLACLFAAAAVPASTAAKGCLEEGELERLLGEQVRSGMQFIDTSHVSDIPLCSGITLAQHMQKMRAAAFPEEAARRAAARAAMIEWERQADAAKVAATATSVVAVDEAPLMFAPAAASPRVLKSQSAAAEHRRAAHPKRAVAAPSGRARGAYYPNCRAARTAGAAPLRAGQAGYSSHLDRDGDGVACE